MGRGYRACAVASSRRLGVGESDEEVDGGVDVFTGCASGFEVEGFVECASGLEVAEGSPPDDG